MRGRGVPPDAAAPSIAPPRTCTSPYHRQLLADGHPAWQWYGAMTPAAQGLTVQTFGPALPSTVLATAGRKTVNTKDQTVLGRIGTFVKSFMMAGIAGGAGPPRILVIVSDSS